MFDNIWLVEIRLLVLMKSWPTHPENVHWQWNTETWWEKASGSLGAHYCWNACDGRAYPPGRRCPEASGPLLPRCRHHRYLLSVCHRRLYAKKPWKRAIRSSLGVSLRSSLWIMWKLRLRGSPKQKVSQLHTINDMPNGFQNYQTRTWRQSNQK